MRRKSYRAALTAGVALLCALPAAARAAEPVGKTCPEGVCTYYVTPAQVLAKAEELVMARQFQEAETLVRALEVTPDLSFERRFLAGYIAVETGRLDDAITDFRAILAQDPGQTRVRLELARALLLKGSESGADYHFRVAQQDGTLPEEISRTIRSTRGVLRSMRTWNFNVDFGLAPDTNINGATNAEAVDIRFGPMILPMELDAEARQQSGIGQTAGFNGGLRLKIGERAAFLIETAGNIVNYQGTAFDDMSAQFAAGPELRLGNTSSLSVQAVGQQRWYGGSVAARQIGLKTGFQKVLDEGQRIGIELDARRNFSGISESYDGWQFGGYAIYERVIARSLIASATLHARRDLLDAKAYSSIEYGLDLGIGGELPLGINAGISGGVGRAHYDGPMYLFSDEIRSDLRFNARAYAGLRTVRLLGFSPSVTYTYGRTDTNYDFYRNDRHRLRFNLARYF